MQEDVGFFDSRFVQAVAGMAIGIVLFGVARRNPAPSMAALMLVLAVLAGIAKSGTA